MRSTFLATTCIFILFWSNASAQKKSYNFPFNHSLWDSISKQKLTAVCSPTYTDHTFTFGKVKVTRPVCHFDKQCGFIFNDTADFLKDGSYTIEMYVELDAIYGANKLIDYLNLADDNGLYENNGACTFRGPGNVSGDVFTNGTYNFVAITRNGTSKEVKMYVNGQFIDGITDDGERIVAMYDANKTLRFIQDDNYSNGTECGIGNIALLTIYNSVCDEAIIKNHLGALAENLKIKPAVTKSTK